jgi:hypothetical protein
MDIKQSFELSEKDIEKAVIQYVQNIFDSTKNSKFDVVLKSNPVYGYGDVLTGHTVTAVLTTKVEPNGE